MKGHESLAHTDSTNISEKPTLPAELHELSPRERKENAYLDLIEIGGEQYRLRYNPEKRTRSERVRRYRLEVGKESKVSPLVSYPVSFLEEQLEPSEVRENVKNVPLEEAVGQQRYDLIRAALQTASPLERMQVRIKAKAFPDLFHGFDERIDQLVADRRPRAATELLKAREIILGSPSVNPETKVKVTEAAKHPPIEIPRESLDPPIDEPVSLPEGLLKFYTDEYVRTALDTLERAPDFTSRAPTALKMGVARLREGTNLATLNIANRLRRYALYAVLTELAYQEKRGLPLFRVELRGYMQQDKRRRYMDMFVDREDVLDFLRAAAGRFVSRKAYIPDAAYGNEPWANIANAGYDIWKTDEPQRLVSAADRFFQLQHNTGSALNKDFHEFTSADHTKSVLDNKFASRDLGELLSSSSAYVYSDQSVASYVKSRLSSLEAVFRLAGTYFPSETTQAREIIKASPELVDELVAKNKALEQALEANPAE